MSNKSNENDSYIQNIDSDVDHDDNDEVAEETGEDEVLFPPKEVLRFTSSSVWNFFMFCGDKIKGPDNKKIQCILCKRKLIYTNSTSTLKWHLTSYHGKKYQDYLNSEKLKKQETQPLIASFTRKDSTFVKKWKKSSQKYKDTTRLISEWLCTNSRPTTIVEDKGFKALMDYIVPEYEIPSRWTISKCITDIYKEEKDKVIEELKGVKHCAITTDGGSSINSISFLDVNVHYIENDSLKLKSKVLAVRENREEHTAENYREHTDDIVQEFGLQNKVVKTVTDNENKMKAAYNDEERNGCISHMLHNSITNSLKDNEPINEVLSKCRKVSGKHNRSYAFRYALEDEQKNLNIKQRVLIQDVATRWGSIRISTSSFLDHKEDMHGNNDDSFRNFEAINNALMRMKWKKETVAPLLFSRSDMIRIKVLNEFLTTFDVYSTTLGGSKFVTCSVVLPTIRSIQTHVADNPDDPSFIRDLKDNVFADFNDRIHRDLDLCTLRKCTALDPRFKKLKVVREKLDREAVFESLERELKSIVESEKKDQIVSLSDDESTSVGSGSLSKKRKLGLDFSESESDEEVMSDMDSIKLEFQCYRKEPVLDQDLDPLEYWNSCRHKYPFLIKLVKKYLCIPATSTEAERTFSSLGNLLSKKRLSLKSENVDAQLFLKDKLSKD